MPCHDHPAACRTPREPTRNAGLAQIEAPEHPLLVAMIMPEEGDHCARSGCGVPAGRSPADPLPRIPVLLHQVHVESWRGAHDERSLARGWWIVQATFTS